MLSVKALLPLVKGNIDFPWERETAESTSWCYDVLHDVMMSLLTFFLQHCSVGTGTISCVNSLRSGTERYRNVPSSDEVVPVLPPAPSLLALLCVLLTRSRFSSFLSSLTGRWRRRFRLSPCPCLARVQGTLHISRVVLTLGSVFNILKDTLIQFENFKFVIRFSSTTRISFTTGRYLAVGQRRDNNL